ncbi:MAG: FAD-dependent oxidoreductase, partial [Bryobacteraceae bacterium]
MSGTSQQLGVLDTAIVGGGVAGLSAALFLGRAGRSVILYDASRQRIRAVERVREYLGFDGLSPE